MNKKKILLYLMNYLLQASLLMLSGTICAMEQTITNRSTTQVNEPQIFIAPIPDYLVYNRINLSKGAQLLAIGSSLVAGAAAKGAVDSFMNGCCCTAGMCCCLCGVPVACCCLSSCPDEKSGKSKKVHKHRESKSCVVQ